MQMDRKLVVVLGLPRSGTSVLTRGLQAIGASPGESLLPATEDNKKGFFEDLDILHINECILSELGFGIYSFVTSNMDLSSKSIFDLQRSALEVLRCKFNKNNFVVIKNPRMTQTLPFWQKIFFELDACVSYVISLRNPLSCADSLIVMHDEKGELNIPRAKSYWLWLQYYALAIEGTNGYRRIIVDYDNLVDDPDKSIRRVADFLSVKIDSDKNFVDYCNSFVDKNLRHNIYHIEDIKNSSSTPRTVIDYYSILSACSVDDADSDELICLTKKCKERLSDTMGLLMLVDKYNHEINKLNDSLINL